MIGYRGLLLAAALLAALPGAQAHAQGTMAVDNAVLGNEAGTDWPAYGRTFSESRFSPLRQVNDSNVSRLGYPRLGALER
jgi:quinohemoprotein ethanol dehydrogenase